MIEKIQLKMMTYYKEHSKDKVVHDINHFLKVHAFSKIIAENENIDKETQDIVEIASIVHDIACPLCREKYGSAPGNLQEKEGPALVYAFLEEFPLDKEQVDRIAYLVGHHHTLDTVDGTDYQILLEADYLVNAYESAYTKENIVHIKKTMFKTKTGLQLMNTLYIEE